jgi:hypothetical protein
LSDLANSCEYLTIDKLCSAVSENEKAKANRQVRCQNEEKMSCCYLCLSRRECAFSCKFLGNIGNEAPSVEVEKNEPKSTVAPDQEIEAFQTQSSPVAFCALCNVEMGQTKTQFKIDGWTGPHPKLSGDASGDDFLPVTVYLCPQCGKIEFKANVEKN